jgi:undecaprenyl-diphosphatase
VLAVGLISGSVGAFVAFWGLLRILEKFSSWPFVIYRALIGFVLLSGNCTDVAFMFAPIG